MEPKKRDINPIFVFIAIVVVAFIILLVITLVNMFRTNPYGKEIRIDNIDKYYSEMAQSEKDMIFNSLYNAVLANYEDDQESIPKNGALVRDGTVEKGNSDTTKYGDFVVDIEKIRQSYTIHFEWYSEKKGNVKVLCVPSDLRIYEDGDVCKDNYATTVKIENEYQVSYSFGAKTSNVILSVVNDILRDNNISITKIIIDETSFAEIRGETTPAFSFIIETDSGNYSVRAKTDAMYGEKYIAVLLTSEKFTVGGVVSDEQNEIDTATNWLRSVSRKEDLQVIVYSKTKYGN